METETGFNLEQAIAKWRNALAAEPGITDDNLRELESHLRESISRHIEGGSTGRSAFDAAAKELGRHEQIVIEHTKVNLGLIWRQRAFWMALAALLVPAMFRFLSILLEIAGQWIPKLDWLRHFEMVQIVFYSRIPAVVAPALCIGLLASACFSEKLRLGGLVDWLAGDRLRLFVLITAPAILYLAAYVMTDHADSVGSWLKNCGVGLGVFLGTVLLVGQLGHGLARGFLNWALATRLRLIGVLALSMAPALLQLAPYLLSDMLPPRAATMLKLGAGTMASTYTIQVLLLVSIVLLHPAVLRRNNAATQSQSINTDRLPMVPDPIWRQRVLWMCSGCLVFFAWGTVDRGFHELLTREIGQWWMRAIIGVVIPIALFWSLKRITAASHQLPGSVARLFDRTPTIVVAAFLLAGLQYTVTRLSWETVSGLWVSSTYAGFNIILNWITSLIWPGAMLGFLFWLKTHFHSEPPQPVLRQPRRRIAGSLRSDCIN